MVRTMLEVIALRWIFPKCDQDWFSSSDKVAILISHTQSDTYVRPPLDPTAQEHATRFKLPFPYITPQHQNKPDLPTNAHSVSSLHYSSASTIPSAFLAFTPVSPSGASGLTQSPAVTTI